MTYYYKQLNESGEIVLLLTYAFSPNITDPLVIEITKEEYNTLRAEIEAANLPDEPDPDEVSDAEALDIILGVSE